MNIKQNKQLKSKNKKEELICTMDNDGETFYDRHTAQHQISEVKLESFINSFISKVDTCDTVNHEKNRIFSFMTDTIWAVLCENRA